MNNTVISGNIVNDLELKFTQSGKEYLPFSVAVKRNYKNAENEYESDFFNVIVYGATAKYLATYGGKGSKVVVNGQLRNRTYTNKNGINVRVTEIIASNIDLMAKQHIEKRPATPQNVQTRPAYPQTNTTYPQNYRTQYQGGVSLTDDDINNTFGNDEISIPEDSLPF